MRTQAGARHWWIIVLLAGIVGLGAASSARAVPTFDIQQLGFGDGPVAVAVAPPSPVSGLPNVADFNGDGKADMAVANADGNTVSIYLNNGSGFPTTPTRNLLGTTAAPLKSPQGIAAGDFNGDGIDDVAVANRDSEDVSVFMGDGIGTACSPSVRIGEPGSRLIAVARAVGVRR